MSLVKKPNYFLYDGIMSESVISEPFGKIMQEDAWQNRGKTGYTYVMAYIEASIMAEQSEFMCPVILADIESKIISESGISQCEFV